MEPRNPFDHHAPGPQAKLVLAKLREQFKALYATIETMPGGPSREKSLAITALQESGMWASRAAVFADPQSVPAAD